MSPKPHTSLILLCAVFALAGAGACSSSESPPTPAEQTIGPEGGEIAITGAKLVVPAGALDSPLSLKVFQASPQLAGDKTFITPIFGFTPHGTSFNQPVTITLSYAGSDELTALRKDDDNDTTWEPVTAASAKGGVTITTDSLSYYGAVKKATGGPSCSDGTYQSSWNTMLAEMETARACSGGPADCGIKVKHTDGSTFCLGFVSSAAAESKMTAAWDAHRQRVKGYPCGDVVYDCSGPIFSSPAFCGRGKSGKMVCSAHPYLDDPTPVQPSSSCQDSQDICAKSQNNQPTTPAGEINIVNIPEQINGTDWSDIYWLVRKDGGPTSKLKAFVYLLTEDDDVGDPKISTALTFPAAGEKKKLGPGKTGGTSGVPLQLWRYQIVYQIYFNSSDCTGTPKLGCKSSTDACAKLRNPKSVSDRAQPLSGDVLIYNLPSWNLPQKKWESSFSLVNATNSCTISVDLISGSGSPSTKKLAPGSVTLLPAGGSISNPSFVP